MKMVVLASLLATAGAAPLAPFCAAQAAPAAQGGVSMQPDEYAKYQTCTGAAAGPAQAAACQDYLKAFPNSAVKNDVLGTIMSDYVAANDNKDLIPAADAVLAANPNNLAAYVFEAQARSQTGDAAGAADYAKKGIALGQPAGVSDQTFQAVKTQGYPVMYSAIANGAVAAGDQAAAIAAFKQELASVPVDQTTKPGLQLQDTYGLATAYYKSTPPDYVNCAFYAARGGDFAPEPYKTTFNQLAKYCYTKFHGNSQGFEAVSTAAQTNLDPPAGFTITPAPKPEDLVATLLAGSDLTTLAPSDREFVLQYGNDDQKSKVFDAVKGKSAKFENLLVVSATAEKIMAAVSDDAIQNKVADYEFDMKTPLKTVPAADSKVTLIGTYASYTANAGNDKNPVSIILSDSEVVTKAVAKPPVHHPVPRKR